VFGHQNRWSDEPDGKNFRSWPFATLRRRSVIWSLSALIGHQPAAKIGGIGLE
jgi:hypothetical protein